MKNKGGSAPEVPETSDEEDEDDNKAKKDLTSGQQDAFGGTVQREGDSKGGEEEREEKHYLSVFVSV